MFLEGLRGVCVFPRKCGHHIDSSWNRVSDDVWKLGGTLRKYGNKMVGHS